MDFCTFLPDQPYSRIYKQANEEIFYQQLFDKTGNKTQIYRTPSVRLYALTNEKKIYQKPSFIQSVQIHEIK